MPGMCRKASHTHAAHVGSQLMLARCTEKGYGTENRPTKEINSGASVGPQDASELRFYRWVRPILSEYLPIAEIYADPALLGAGSRSGDQAQLGAGLGVQTRHSWGRSQGYRPCTAGDGGGVGCRPNTAGAGPQSSQHTDGEVRCVPYGPRFCLNSDV